MNFFVLYSWQLDSEANGFPRQASHLLPLYAGLTARRTFMQVSFRVSIFTIIIAILIAIGVQSFRLSSAIAASNRRYEWAEQLQAGSAKILNLMERRQARSDYYYDKSLLKDEESTHSSHEDPMLTCYKCGVALHNQTEPSKRVWVQLTPDQSNIEDRKIILCPACDKLPVSRLTSAARIWQGVCILQSIPTDCDQAQIRKQLQRFKGVKVSLVDTSMPDSFQCYRDWSYARRGIKRPTRLARPVYPKSYQRPLLSKR